MTLEQFREEMEQHCSEEIARLIWDLKRYFRGSTNLQTEGADDPISVEDLINRSLMRLYEKSFKEGFVLKHGQTVKQYLITSVRMFLGEQRKKKKKRLGYLLLKPFTVDLSLDEWSLQEMRELLKLVKEELLHINVLYYQPLMMHAEGFSYSEISKELEISADTARQRVSRGRKELKKLMKDKWGFEGFGTKGLC